MQRESFKSGFVTLLGKPNVGKSTLLNKMIGQHISITADKPQTTRNNIRGIITGEDYQAVILDTPGVHLPRNELHRRIVNYAVQSISDSDLVFLLTEPFARDQSGVRKDDQLVLQYLKDIADRVVLIINKTDLTQPEMLLRTIAVFNESFKFLETVPISALKGNGIDVLKKILRQHLPPGPPYYPGEQFTDAPERVITGELVREQIMRLCFHEIPYGVAVIVEAFKETSKVVNIFATIYVEKPSQKKIIIGKNGSMLKKVGTNSRKKIEQLLGAKVYLSLHVKIAKNWFNNPKKLAELGYTKI